ncbi:MAG: hypothetical protein ACRDN0_25905 [Trebonia sp.]
MTLLFTDIEGGVRLWEADSDAMAAASARCDHIVREQVEAYGGRVFKAVGEAYRAVFPDPVAALSAAVAAICVRLDGIPLALELAAARVGSLSAPEINARLDQRFRLLTTGNRTARPRHQTLRALIDWSYDMLTSEEQIVFDRLSVFAGGWTLDAAEAVASGGDVPEWQVLDLLAALVSKSLVQADVIHGSTRYRLLETVRHYAAEHLALRAGSRA